MCILTGNQFLTLGFGLVRRSSPASPGVLHRHRTRRAPSARNGAIVAATTKWVTRRHPLGDTNVSQGVIYEAFTCMLRWLTARGGASRAQTGRERGERGTGNIVPSTRACESLHRSGEAGLGLQTPKGTGPIQSAPHEADAMGSRGPPAGRRMGVSWPTAAADGGAGGPHHV